MPHGSKGRRWERLRRLAKDRDNWMCVMRSDGRCRGRLEVDHVIPVADGGAEWDIANLQVLCRSHHLDKSRAEHSFRMNVRNPPTKAEQSWAEMVQEL